MYVVQIDLCVHNMTPWNELSGERKVKLLKYLAKKYGNLNVRVTNYGFKRQDIDEVGIVNIYEL